MVLKIIVGLEQRDGIMRCIKSFGYLLSVGGKTNAEGRQQLSRTFDQRTDSTSAQMIGIGEQSNEQAPQLSRILLERAVLVNQSAVTFAQAKVLLNAGQEKSTEIFGIFFKFVLFHGLHTSLCHSLLS